MNSFETVDVKIEGTFAYITLNRPAVKNAMNNQMVLFQAGKFAERVKREAGADPLAQIKRAVFLALGRPADAIELKSGVAFVKESPDGLTEFCHILLNLNEFLYRP